MAPWRPLLHIQPTPKYFVLAVIDNHNDIKKNDSQVNSITSNASSSPSSQTTTSNIFSGFSDLFFAIFLDVNEPYTRDMILKAFANPRWKSIFSIEIGPGEGMESVSIPQHVCAAAGSRQHGLSFQWSEYERIDWEAVESGKHGASSYRVRKGLSRKAQLCYYIYKHASKNPDSVLQSAIPQTLILDTWPVWEDNCTSSTPREGLADIVVADAQSTAGGTNRRERLDMCLKQAKHAMQEAEDLFESSSGEPPVWILKPSTVNKGEGIQILHIYEQLVDLCWSEPDIREWVLQRYMNSPMLLKKRKFHIRAYILAVSNLKVYFSRNALALCAGTRYEGADTSNYFAHITNTAYQEEDPNFVEQDCVLIWNANEIAPILFNDGTCRNLGEAKNLVNRVVSNMEAITSELFRAYEHEIGVFCPIEGCFEHYGLDFIVDSTGAVWLLEVNPGPDFKQTGDRLSPVIEKLMTDTIEAVFLQNAWKYPQSQPKATQRCGDLRLVFERARQR